MGATYSIVIKDDHMFPIGESPLDEAFLGDILNIQGVNHQFVAHALERIEFADGKEIGEREHNALIDLIYRTAEFSETTADLIGNIQERISRRLTASEIDTYTDTFVKLSENMNPWHHSALAFICGFQKCRDEAFTPEKINEYAEIFLQTYDYAWEKGIDSQYVGSAFESIFRERKENSPDLAYVTAVGEYLRAACMGGIIDELNALADVLSEYKGFCGGRNPVSDITILTKAVLDRPLTALKMIEFMAEASFADSDTSFTTLLTRYNTVRDLVRGETDNKSVRLIGFLASIQENCAEPYSNIELTGIGKAVYECTEKLSPGSEKGAYVLLSRLKDPKPAEIIKCKSCLEDIDAHSSGYNHFIYDLGRALRNYSSTFLEAKDVSVISCLLNLSDSPETTRYLMRLTEKALKAGALSTVDEVLKLWGDIFLKAQEQHCSPIKLDLELAKAV
jgi:hypothetical protein